MRWRRGTVRCVDALEDALRVISSMNEAGVDYVVVGGVAMNLHGLVRATEDLDLFIRPEPENVERLRQALRAVWSDPSIDEITAEDLCGDYPAVRYGPPEGTLYLDILTRLGQATVFNDLEVEERAVEGVVVRVATPRTLYRMKRHTVLLRLKIFAAREDFRRSRTASGASGGRGGTERPIAAEGRARRPIDHADAAALRAAFELDDED